jgi:hypothetical protein
VRYKPHVTGFEGKTAADLAVPLPDPPAAAPLDARPFLALDQSVRRGVADCAVALDLPPDGLLRWARTLPAGYVPVDLASDATEPTRRTHGIALKLTENVPAFAMVYQRDRYPASLYPSGYRDLTNLRLRFPDAGESFLYVATADWPNLYYWMGGIKVADLAKISKEWQATDKLKPYHFSPDQSADGDLHLHTMSEFGRDKWRTEPALPRDKLAAYAAECDKAGLYLHRVIAHLDAAGSLRFGVIAWENPDGRKTLFRMDMDRADFLKELAAQKRAGLFPVTVASYGDPADSRYAASWVRFRPPE